MEVNVHETKANVSKLLVSGAVRFRANATLASSVRPKVNSLIAQSRAERLSILTADPQLTRYDATFA